MRKSHFGTLSKNLADSFRPYTGLFNYLIRNSRPISWLSKTISIGFRFLIWSYKFRDKKSFSGDHQLAMLKNFLRLELVVYFFVLWNSIFMFLTISWFWWLLSTLLVFRQIQRSTVITGQPIYTIGSYKIGRSVPPLFLLFTWETYRIEWRKILNSNRLVDKITLHILSL